MNVLSFFLAVAAIIMFIAAQRGVRRAHLGVGLSLLTAAWVIQSIWVTTHTVAIR